MGLFNKKKKRDKEKDQPQKKEGVKVEKKVKEVEKNKKKEDKKENFKVSSSGNDLKKIHAKAYKQLVRPLITEKSSLVGMYNQYVFEIAPKTNKVEIKKAIQALYGVKALKVNTINMRGKTVRYGRRYGKLKNWKKVIVTLKQGDKIDVYEGV